MKLSDILKGACDQNFKVLSKVISLAESSKVEHAELVNDFLEKATQYESKVIGVTGTPGAGKSTFLNALCEILGQDKKIAILTIDPSSERSGGSILGDKTRMRDLINNENVFIRPSPSQSILGGVSIGTYKAISVCKSFGFDYVFIESVGVGQSESHLSKMVDMTLLLLSPAGGDELQGIKRGVLEEIDLLLVNKMDGELVYEAEKTANLYASSGHDALLISSLEKNKIDKVIEKIEKFYQESNIVSVRKEKKESLYEIILNQYASQQIKEYLRVNGHKNLSFNDSFLKNSIKEIFKSL